VAAKTRKESQKVLTEDAGLGEGSKFNKQYSGKIQDSNSKGN
jgi:hypothetical protein